MFLDETQAIQSLLQVQNCIDQQQDWEKTDQNIKFSNKKKEKLNFIQINKKLNPQLQLNLSKQINDKMMNFCRFKRANSLFDPIKAYKNISPTQLSYQQPLTPQPIIGLKKLQSNKQKMFNNKIYSSDSINFEQYKDKSKQFLNGQSVMIQVQSFQSNYNKKQIQYIMSKTFANRKFYSQIKDHNSTCTLLQLKIKNNDMQSKYDNKSEKTKPKNNFSITSKMRFSSAFNKKSDFKQQLIKSPRKSLQIRRKQKNDQITMSIRYLLNNLSLQQKSKLSPSRLSNQTNLRIFDKQRMFKAFEQQQMKRIKNIKQGQFYDLSEKNFISTSETSYCLKRPIIVQQTQLIKKKQKQVSLKKILQTDERIQPQKKQKQIVSISPKRFVKQKSAVRQLHLSKKPSDEFSIFNIKKIV